MSGNDTTKKKTKSKSKKPACKQPKKSLQERVKEVLDKMKWSLGGSVADPGPIRDMHKKLNYELQKVVDGVNSASSIDVVGTHIATPEERLQNRLKSVDPVLAHCIAAKLGRADLKDLFEDKAYHAYIAEAETYDEVLDDNVPEELREAAAPYVAQRRYREGSNATASEDWESFLTDFHEQHDRLSTGLPSLDSAIGGGLSGLNVIAADEGDGKTSLCVDMLLSALRADPNLGCVYYTIDQSKTKTNAKCYSHVSGLSLDVLRKAPENRTEVENAKAEKAAEELKNELLPRIKFVERGNLSSNQSIDIMLRKNYLDLFHNSVEVYPILVVIDMFQSLVQLNQDAGTANEADEACLDAIQRFILWSRNGHQPEGSSVILVSEVRKVDRVELTSNDLRGSARLGSAADNILLMWPTPGTEQTGPTVSRTLKVAKSRNGDEGIIHLDFHHKICQFSEPSTKGGSSNGSRRKTRGKAM